MQRVAKIVNCCFVENSTIGDKTPTETQSPPLPPSSLEIDTGPKINMPTSMKTRTDNDTAANVQSEPPTATTFQKQDTLPRLPIPTLSSTLTRFVQAVTPLLTPSQLKETKTKVQSFLQNDGPKLQSLLEEYDAKAASDGTFGSYIEEFWNDAYLVPDTSVVLNLNPYFLLEEDADSKIAKCQILRAAALTFSSLKFAASLKNETMKADVFKRTTLCMDQFKSLFGSCRIPKKGESDVVEVTKDSSHVVVLFRNQFYYFRGLWPKSSNKDGEVKVAVNQADIAQILRTIVKDGKNISKAESVDSALGVLTTLPRNSWADAREKLKKISKSNEDALHIIESALFVLALDEFAPEDVHQAAANMLHGTHFMVQRDEGNDDSTNLSMRNFHPSIAYQGGTCCNRFYDKLQIIVCEDGSAGINFEHSAIDGHTTLRFVSDIFAETIVDFAKSVTKSIYSGGSLSIPSILNANIVRASDANQGKKKGDTTYFDTSPKKIHFEMDEHIKDSIFFAETKLGDAVNGDDTFILEFPNFGKNLIVHNSMSPDSFVQMTLLIAYYRLYGEVVSSYESVLTKRFFHGRTEAMRSTTTVAEEMMKCWNNTSSTEEEKLTALRNATKQHSKLVKEASEGNGVDRHLYALKCIGEKNDIYSELFSSDAWKALNHTVISTSNCGNPSLRLFGFGPVCPDGFGIGYIIKDSGLQYSISSKHRQTQRYALSLNETLLEMEELLHPLHRQQMGSPMSPRREVENKRRIFRLKI
mmetsp:Transcript_9880/g.14727  ORF Transcript_9880/g.14727 Transcript_9880/m.14727 type:complete len:755 (-) Transcript_9880:757-3021(-)